MAGNIADVITCAKFQDEIFRGYDFTGGRISHFPIDFYMGLTTVQRDCAACDYRVIRVTGSIRVTGQLVPGRVGSRVSTADPVPSLLCWTVLECMMTDCSRQLGRRRRSNARLA